LDIHIERLPDTEVGRLAHFTLPPEQSMFADLPSQAAGVAGREGHVILADGQPVGFFAIQPDYGTAYDFAPDDAIGLRMFSIDHAAQGKGHATAACRLLTGYLAAAYPGRAACYLTVNVKNPGARRVYEKGGFVDTGALYLGGGYGPQHVMRLALD